MSADKIARCTFCGETGPVFVDGRFKVCDSPECDREYNDAMRDIDEQAREDAERDEYSLYRGGW